MADMQEIPPNGKYSFIIGKYMAGLDPDELALEILESLEVVLASLGIC